jgi:hypothetical protein
MMISTSNFKFNLAQLALKNLGGGAKSCPEGAKARLAHPYVDMLTRMLSGMLTSMVVALGNGRGNYLQNFLLILSYLFSASGHFFSSFYVDYSFLG